MFVSMQSLPTWANVAHPSNALCVDIPISSYGHLGINFFPDTPCTIPTHLALPRAGHKLTALREQSWEQTTLYTLHFTLHTVHSALYTHTSHFTLYALHSTLYTPHSTLCTPPSSAFHGLLCTGTVTGEKCTRLFKRFVSQKCST